MAGERERAARGLDLGMTEKPFNVSDKRHFTSDGRPREAEAEARLQPDATEGTRGRAASAPADFAQFLLSLGAQAGMLLSGGAEKGAPDAEALESARSLISILEMLSEKTEGRRTEDEDRILEGLLFELRMAYVQATRARRA